MGPTTSEAEQTKYKITTIKHDSALLLCFFVISAVQTIIIDKQ